MAEKMILHPSSSTVVFAVLLNVFFTGTYGNQVPLILWSSGGSPIPEASPPAGHVVSSSQLSSLLASVLSSGPRAVVLFQQDKLSIDDFTVFGGVFGNEEDGAFPNLKVSFTAFFSPSRDQQWNPLTGRWSVSLPQSALQNSSGQLVLPSVSQLGSSRIVQLLQEQLRTTPLYLEPKNLAQLHLSASDPALLVVRLPYSGQRELLDGLTTGVSCAVDGVIGRILDIMKAQAIPYTAIYTAHGPSQVIQEQSLDSQLVGRSLLQTNVYAPVQFNDSSNNACILFWANNFTVSVYQGKWEMTNLTTQTFAQTPKLDGSKCSDTDSRLSINYENVLGFKSFRVTFVMSQRDYKVSARKWFTLDQILLEYDNQNTTLDDTRDIYAPGEYSYHCESVNIFSSAPRTPSATQWMLTFGGFQIQGFSVTKGRFSYANDCASFFTPAIWMGLLTSLLMLLILTYGLHMIMQVCTMDRFDDPKGPTISVPQNE
ncbi:V-type proton ATPase subunit S1-like [Scleropages formosus]|uniref:V-type proton ATPase subunit S1-like n=1 Tax=Scleropages formosus TaxID=113540 RepID=A0A0N8JWI9_SCLFO|nr:V-type proton ATPase subunit S1-like [Scleropages formosus]